MGLGRVTLLHLDCTLVGKPRACGYSSWFSEWPVLGADGIGMGVHVTVMAKWILLFSFYFWD